MAVLEDGYDPITRQTVSLPVVRERAARAFEPIDTAAEGANPEHAGPVHVKRPDAVVAETGLVEGIVPIAGHVTGGRVEVIQTATQRAHPKTAVGVLGECPDPVAAQGRAVCGVEAIDRGRAACRVEAI